MITLPESLQKEADITAEALEKSITGTFIIASFNFEISSIIASLLIDGEISLNTDAVKSLREYLRITILGYFVGVLALDIFEIPLQDFIDYPLLNRAKILEGDCSLFGPEKINSLLV